MSRFTKVLTIITLGICLALPAVTSMLVRADDALPEVTVLRIPDENMRTVLLAKLGNRVDPVSNATPTAKLAPGAVPYANKNLYSSDINALKGITSLLFTSNIISDFTGIEYAENITQLDIAANGASGLKPIDLSSLTKLTKINAPGNRINGLILGSKPVLTELNINNNELTEIDLSGCTNLTKLSIQDNQLTSLDLTSNPKITTLNFANNQIANLKLASTSTLSSSTITSQVQNLNDQWIVNDPSANRTMFYLHDIFSQAEIDNIKSITATVQNEYFENITTNPSNSDWQTTGVAKFPSGTLQTNKGFDIKFGNVKTGSSDYVSMHITLKLGFVHRFSSNDTTLGTVDSETEYRAIYGDDYRFTVTATPKEGCKFKYWKDSNGNVIPGDEGTNPVLSRFVSNAINSFQAVFYADRNNNNIPDDEEGNLIIKDPAGNIVQTFPDLLRANAIIMFDNAGTKLEEFTIAAAETVKTFPTIDKKVLIGATGELNSDNKFEVKPIYTTDRNNNGEADNVETHYQVEPKTSEFGSVTLTPNSDLLVGEEVKLTVKTNKNYILKTILVNGHDIGKVDRFTIDNTMLMTRAAAGTIVVEAVFEEDMNNDGIPDSTQTKYSVTVDKVGEGDASANTTQAVDGRDVRLIAQPKAGYEFKGWKSSDVKITNGKFTMPKKAVKVTAIFEKNPGGGTTGSMTLKPSASGDQPVNNADGTITIPNNGIVVLPGGMEVTLPKGGTMLQDGTVAIPVGGSVVYPNGKKVTLDDGGILYANGTITDDNGDVVMSLPNGGSSDTIVIKPNPGGNQPTNNPNGTITIPNNSVVIITGGNEVSLPDGGTMLLDGSVSIPAGGSVIYPNGKEVVLTNGGVLHANGTLTDNSGNILMGLPNGGSTGSITLKPNADGSQPIVNPNGTTSIAGNSVVVLTDGKEMTLPSGGTLLLDGTVYIPVGGTVVYPDGRIGKAPKGGILHANGTLTDLDGNIIMTMSNVTPGDNTGGSITIKPNPDGEQPVQNPDGTITIPKKSVVVINGGLEVSLPDGGTMLLNGTVSIPAGGRVIYPNGKVVTLPKGGILHANGTITDMDGNIIMTLPQTGDHTAKNMYLGLAVVSMIGIGFVLYKTKFEKE